MNVPKTLSINIDLLERVNTHCYSIKQGFSEYVINLIIADLKKVGKYDEQNQNKKETKK